MLMTGFERYPLGLSIFKIYSSNFKQLREIIPLFSDCNCIALSIEIFSKQIEKDGDAFNRIAL